MGITVGAPSTKSLQRKSTPQAAENDLLATLQAAGRKAVQVADWKEFLTDLAGEAMRAVGADRAFLALVNEDTGELFIHAATGEGWTKERRAQRLRIAASGVAEWAISGNSGFPVDKVTTAGGESRRGITGHVAATGKTYVTGNVTRDPHYYEFFKDVVSEVAVPIRDADRKTRGVLNLQSVNPDHFRTDHVLFLESLADLASMRLTTARYSARESALVELGKNLTAIADIASLMRRVVDVAADVLRFEDCSLFILDRDRNELILQATRGPLADKIGIASYPMGEGLTGWVAQHGEPIRIGEPKADPRWQGRYEEMPTEEIGAFLAVPIYGRNHVQGVLRVLRRRSKAPWFRSEFTAEDESVLATIASQVGSALENSRMLDRLVAAERMAAWGEMSAKAAHMIGNRTFAVKGDLNELEFLLSEKKDRRKEFRALAEAIRVGIFRLEEILQEFRDFVRATQITLSDQDVNEILRQCMEESFPKRGPVQLKLSLQKELPLIPADPIRLKRAFSELIENAVSFMPDGGTLTIRTSLADPRDARSLGGLTRSRSYVRIDFIDSGPGVPDDSKARIFMPFYTSRAKGMGLGLSIVKGIMEAHRGNISEIGVATQGAWFVVFLPIQSQ
jgi:signal transduction histidine kinase